MKKFSFNLESLLTLREWEERKAMQRLAVATNALSQLQQDLADLEEQRDSVFANWQTFGARSFAAKDRIGLEGHVAELSRRGLDLQNSIQSATAEREKAMQSLMVATRGKKIVENLKQKRLAEYNAEMFRQEAAEIEDIYSSRRKVM